MKFTDKKPSGRRITDRQIQRLVQYVLADLEAQNTITYKAKRETVVARALDIIKANYQKEYELDQEVHKMLDDLERKNPGEFQRFKMFPLLKKRLAKEKGFIL